MGTASRGAGGSSTENDRTGVRPTEQLFGRKFGAVARVLWPHKTAAELAYRVGVTERAAEYWLAGKRKPTPRALVVVMNELIAE